MFSRSLINTQLCNFNTVETLSRHVHKSEKWTGMYLCVRGIDFASFCDYLLHFVFRYNHHDLYNVYFSNDRLNIKWGKYHTVTFSATYIFIFINFQMNKTSEIREIHYYHPFPQTSSVEELIQEMHFIQV